jgi:hypothetical protein
MASTSAVWFLLAFFGGFLGLPTGKLVAPRDSAQQASAWVLPDAHIAFHVNVEASLKGTLALLDEVARLKVVTGSKELSQGLQQIKTEVTNGLQTPNEELGLDLAKDVGNITFSMRLDQGMQFKLLMRARGNFANSKLKDQVSKEAASTETLGKYTIYRMPDDASVKDNVVCFVDDTTILLGDRAFIEEALSGKRGKPAADSVNQRIASVAGAGIETFMYLSLPEWTLAFLAFEPELQQFLELLKGTDYVLWAAGPKKGLGVLQANNAQQAQRVYYLNKSAAAVLGIMDPATDAAAYGLLGLAPLIPVEEDTAELLRLASDEQTVLEFAAWFKKRFAGKAKVTKNDKTFRVTLELTNPGSVLGLALPFIAGGLAWQQMRSAPPPEEFPYDPAYDVPPETDVPLYHVPDEGGEGPYTPVDPNDADVAPEEDGRLEGPAPQPPAPPQE